MTSQKPYIFLLGGHDLEMMEIKRILITCGYQKDVHYFDKGLKWSNAVWSAYAEEIKEIKTINIEQTEKANFVIVGIELFEDDFLKKEEEWSLIDHHNELSDGPTSLQQLITLLNYTPTSNDETRHLELIIANDRDGIAGLRLICATAAEIKKIRNEEAEIIAVENTIQQLFNSEEHNKNFRKENNVRIIKTSATAFYGLTDSLEDANVIIYNNTQLFFSGTEAKKTVLNFFKSVSGLKFYYGGYHIGYIGTILLPETITLNDLVDGIIRLHQLNAQSFHTFMFPFRWDYFNKAHLEKDLLQPENIALRERLNFTVLNEMLNNTKNNEDFLTWEPKEFNIEKASDIGMKYNEYMYFHPFVHQFIYDLPEDNGTNKELTKYYELKEGNEGAFNIQTSKNLYQLSINGISLHVFSKGIGVLTFQLQNDSHSNYEEILDINDYGRRIYPQFISTQNSSISNIHYTQFTFLPTSVTVTLMPDSKSKKIIFEDFSFFNCNAHLTHRNLVRLPNFILKLFTDSFVTKLAPSKEDCILIRPSIDDRMFTVCAIGNSFIANELTNWVESKQEYVFESSERWNRLIFSDSGSCTTQSRHLLKKLNKIHTYDRWVNEASLYGISRETLLLLTTDFKPNSISYNVLSQHMRYMYYQISIICLAQRAGMLRFSYEVGALASLDTNRNITLDYNQQQSDEINYLHLSYIEFVNKMFFREVTPQIQGIEIYDKMHDVMRMDEDITELDREIQELYEYSMAMQQREETKSASDLNKLATIFLPITVIFGIMGANIFDDVLSINGVLDISAIVLIIIGIFIGLLIYLLLQWHIKKSNNKTHIKLNK